MAKRAAAAGKRKRRETDPTWHGERRQLMWDFWQGSGNSFGDVTVRMIEALDGLGVAVSMLEGHRVTDPRLKSLLKTQEAPSWGVRHTVPSSPARLPVPMQARYTMWEWDRLPHGWAQNVNAQDKLLAVPSRQQKELFASSGVTVPIAVVGHGVDQSVFGYRPPPKSGPFTFGSMGYLSDRKGIDVLIRAFVDEFSHTKDVRLVLKTGPKTSATWDRMLRDGLPSGAPPIEAIHSHVTEPELAAILGTFHVGLFPSRGEGFGLGGLQTMSVGRPVICTRWGGMVDYLNPAFNFALDFEMEPADPIFTRLYGADYHPNWARPSYEHLRQLMRRCYEHPKEMARMGKAAHAWVRDEWTWARAARQLVDAIDACARGLA